MLGIIWEFFGQRGFENIPWNNFYPRSNNFMLHVMVTSGCTSTTVDSLSSAVEVDSHFSIVTLYMPHLPFQ